MLGFGIWGVRLFEGNFSKAGGRALEVRVRAEGAGSARSGIEGPGCYP